MPIRSGCQSESTLLCCWAHMLWLVWWSGAGVAYPPEWATGAVKRGQSGVQGLPVGFKSGHAALPAGFKFFFNLMGNHDLTMTTPHIVCGFAADERLIVAWRE